MPPVDASGHSVAPSSEISKIGVAAVLIERGGQHRSSWSGASVCGAVVTTTAT